MTQLLAERGAEVWHTDWRALLGRARELGGVDSLIVDAPYSERTHVANDCSAGRDPRSMKDPGKVNRPLNYACWSHSDVAAFCSSWCPAVRGWMVSVTDHVLARAWADEMEAAGRYVFSPIACVQSGSRIRLLGDGPAQWSTFAVVSRPRDGAWLSSWRSERLGRGEVVSLPGAYVVPPGESDRSPVVGGKPLWLMRALVRDYTRPGNLVCDPCCGAGTTGMAAIMEGRRVLLGDAMEEHARLAVERLRAMPGETKAGQLALLGGSGE